MILDGFLYEACTNTDADRIEFDRNGEPVFKRGIKNLIEPMGSDENQIVKISLIISKSFIKNNSLITTKNAY